LIYTGIWLQRMDNNDMKYYFPFEEDFRDISKIWWLKYDDSGVIMSSRKKLQDNYRIRNITPGGDDKDYYYHPVVIAQCFLGCYNLIVTGYNQSYEYILKANLKWLETNGLKYKNSLLYPFPFSLPVFNQQSGRVSGMYQGQILSCFVRAAYLYDKKIYHPFCEKVWNSFAVSIGKQYGFRYEGKNELWFEEVPQDPPNHILNGYIFAIWGIFDYIKLTANPLAKEAWDKCIKTLKNNISKYDTGFWSNYDLRDSLSSYAYHNRIHVRQLEVLAQLTGEEIFYHYAMKWKGYNRNPLCRIRKSFSSARQTIKRKEVKKTFTKWLRSN
jgi:heparosan-N-sulfate-glucuronate 5-epimerase